VRDLVKYPELVLLDRLTVWFPISYAFFYVVLGQYLEQAYPELHTNGLAIVVWGYFVSSSF